MYKNNAFLIIFVIIVFGAIIGTSTFWNQANNPEAIAKKDDQKQISTNIQTISQIEGQKIKSIEGANLVLENNQKLDLGQTQIRCQAGDTIENYNASNQSLVCIRKDSNGNSQSILMPLLVGAGSGLLASYIGSKIFTQNRGINRVPGSYNYQTQDGQVVNPKEERDASGRYRSFGGFGSGSTGFGFGNGGSDSSTKKSGSGTASGASKGGISGTKSGSGGG